MKLLFPSLVPSPLPLSFKPLLVKDFPPRGIGVVNDCFSLLKFCGERTEFCCYLTKQFRLGDSITVMYLFCISFSLYLLHVIHTLGMLWPQEGVPWQERIRHVNWVMNIANWSKPRSLEIKLHFIEMDEKTELIIEFGMFLYIFIFIRIKFSFIKLTVFPFKTISLYLLSMGREFTIQSEVEWHILQFLHLLIFWLLHLQWMIW